jgi:hypothetical protein
MYASHGIRYPHRLTWLAYITARASHAEKPWANVAKSGKDCLRFEDREARMTEKPIFPDCRFPDDCRCAP